MRHLLWFALGPVLGCAAADPAVPSPSPVAIRRVILSGFEDRSEFGRGKAGDNYRERVFTRLATSGRFELVDGRQVPAEYVITGTVDSIGVRTEGNAQGMTQLAEARVTLTVVRVRDSVVLYRDEQAGRASRSAPPGGRMSYDQTLPLNALLEAAERAVERLLQANFE